MKRALLCLLIACGGSSKPQQTTPKAGSGSASGDPSAMQNTPAPDNGGGGGSNTQANNTPAPTPPPPQDTTPPEPPIQYPNYDPDPAQAKAAVDQHLQVAKNALNQPTPDADTALREAREALKIDAANLDAAAYVAFAFYHKKQYDTAELVLDDVFKRPAAKVRFGDIQYDRAQKIANMPIPKVLEKYPEVVEAFEQQRDQALKQDLDEAKGDWKDVYEKAKAAGISNKWSQHAAENLSREFPEEYHTLRQELVQGTDKP